MCYVSGSGFDKGCWQNVLSQWKRFDKGCWQSVLRQWKGFRIRETNRQLAQHHIGTPTSKTNSVSRATTDSSTNNLYLLLKTKQTNKQTKTTNTLQNSRLHKTRDRLQWPVSWPSAEPARQPIRRSAQHWSECSRTPASIGRRLSSFESHSWSGDSQRHACQHHNPLLFHVAATQPTKARFTAMPLRERDRGREKGGGRGRGMDLVASVNLEGCRFWAVFREGGKK